MAVTIWHDVRVCGANANYAYVQNHHSAAKKKKKRASGKSGVVSFDLGEMIAQLTESTTLNSNNKVNCYTAHMFGWRSH